MNKILSIISLLFAIFAVISTAGCAGKTHTSENEIQRASEQVTTAVATTNVTATNVTATYVAASAASVTPVAKETSTSSIRPETSVTSTPSETTESMKGMSSISSTNLDSSSAVVDVVCKMVIDKTTAEFTSEYKGTTYYFCALSCKQEFDENPDKYIISETTEDETQEDSEQVTTSGTPAEANSTNSTSDPEKYQGAHQEAPIAAFIASSTLGNTPLNVTFTDTSTGTPTSWNWSFGDGNTSFEQNPLHIYYRAGNYTVNLTVTNTNGTNTTFAIITVFQSIQSELPVVNFSSNVTKGYAPLSVQFRDLSENAIEWNWDFGDGTNSTDKKPVHTYSKTGKYNISLTVNNVNRTNTVIKYSYIIVNSSKVIDLVCKMKIDKRTAKLKSEYKGKTYYFCSTYCKTEFDKNPGKYIIH
jgi:PKD repeat protein